MARRVHLRSPAVLLSLALFLAAAGGCRRESGAARAAAAASLPELPARPNLVLVTVDTLRADHLSAWGYPRPTSPALDALAASGVRFAAAQVQWPKTGPSFASIHTATYGKDNGIVRQVGIPLPCSLRMLAEELSELGYQTAAVVANGALGREFFFDQGFDDYLETWKLAAPAAEADADPNRAERVTELALGLLDRFRSDAPFFLWVHYLDPHAPYSPPPTHRDLFQNDGHFDPGPRVPIDRTKHKMEMTGIGRSQALEGSDQVAFYVARYDAEIRYTDDQIARLLERLGQRGLAPKTAIAFTADHGESLGDHDYWFAHGRFAFQTCLHVPLVLAWPGVIPARVDPEPVELLHLAPTLLELAGKRLEGGRWMQGRSLLRRLFGVESEPASGLAFSEAGYQRPRQWIRAVRDRRFKLVWAPSGADQKWIGGPGVKFALYDLAADPGETSNVLDAHPQEVQRLQRELWAWDRAEPFAVGVDGASCGGERALDAETEQLLRSLGYL